MTESGGLVRLLTPRSQHISWSRLESSEVKKGAIVPFNPSSFSAIERLPLPLSVRMKNIKAFHCLPKWGFYNTFLMIKQVLTVWGDKVNCKTYQG